MRRHVRRWLIAAALAVVACTSAAAPPASSASASASPAITAATLSPTPRSTPAASAAVPSRTFDNVVLGYRITFPDTYRRSWSRVFTSGGTLGNDYFTTQTEAEAKAECLQDSGDAGGAGKGFDSDVLVSVFLNPQGMSPATFAATPQCAGCDPPSKFHTIETTTIGGSEAARLAWEQTRETDQFIVKANERLYQLGPVRSSLPSSLAKGWLEAIASTFVAIAPAPLPVPTPSAPPRNAVAQIGQALAHAFAASDADAVMALASTCWLSVWPVVDGVPPGGVLWRSVPQFTQGLRERFAAGDLTVTLDPTVRVETSYGAERFYVTSQWKGPEGTRRVDLFISELDGRWLWREAAHQVTRADMAGTSCWPLLYPWTARTGGC